jgi:hypothetical protein
MTKKKIVVKKEKQEIEILTAAEVKKIDKAVNFINKQANAPAKSLLEIGKYLLKEFFDDDIKKVEDRAPRKGISLRKIAEHEDITMTFMSLSNAVRLAAQESLFTDDKHKTLTETHKLLLFSLPDDKTKKSYAAIVVKENLSIRAFRDLLTSKGLIAARGRAGISGGKIATDPFDRFFSPIERLLSFDIDPDAVDSKALTLERVNALTELRNRIDKLLAKVPKKK